MSTKYMVMRYIPWGDMSVMGFPIKVDDNSIGFVPIWDSYAEAYAHTSNGKFQIVSIDVGDPPNEDSKKGRVQKPRSKSKRKS